MPRANLICNPTHLRGDRLLKVKYHFFDTFMKGKMSCTLTLVCMSAGVYRDQRYLNNQIIFIHLRFIICSYLYTRGLGARVGVLVCGGDVPHMLGYAHPCMHIHEKYMFRNFKWPPPWRHPCLSCLTCLCACVSMCLPACTCVHGGYPTHPHPVEMKLLGEKWTSRNTMLM